MLRASRIQNPWTEDPQNLAAAARAATLRAIQIAGQSALHLPELKEPLARFTADLEVISEKLRGDPSFYRSSRGFFAVHLPSILAALGTLEGLKTRDADKARRSAIADQIAQCLLASRDVRDRIDTAELDVLEIETSALRGSINETPSLCESGNTPPSGSLAGRLVRGLQGAQSSVGTAITKGRDEMSRLSAETRDRANAGVKASGLYLSGLVEESAHAVTSPVARHAAAIRHALGRATGNAIADGLVTALVFPPAVPIAVGLALLDSGGDYLQALEAGAIEDRKADVLRRQSRQEKIEQQVRRLKGQSPIVRLETEHLHIALNLSTNEAQGTILTGAYAGQMLHDIDAKTIDLLQRTAPDQDTKDLLMRWISRSEVR